MHIEIFDDFDDLPNATLDAIQWAQSRYYLTTDS
jgi:hypothetical protein